MWQLDGNVVFISPHLDDAVFACGRLISTYGDAAVVTVCAGLPDDVATLTEWDAACGFASAAQAMAERREEDSAALERVLDECGADTAPATKRSAKC